MTMFPSPAGFLPKGAFELIDAHAGFAEATGYLAEEVVELVYREGWFRMLTPSRWGGWALPLPEVVRVEEALAFADGSLGWVVTLCSGAGWFGGFLPERFGEVFMNEQLCVAGSGSATGEAHPVAGGYRVNGNWAYASGIRHATAYTANCLVWKDGEQVLEAGGKPMIRPFLFLPGEVRIRDDWNAMGLVASGSHGFSVEDVLVPAERMFEIDAAAATDGDALYRYPFLPLAEATLAANISGMGLHFIDCCADYFGRRAMPEAEGLLAEARRELEGLRRQFYQVLDNSWEMLVDGHGRAQVRPGPTGGFSEVGRVSHRMAAKVREWAHLLYPYAGLGAARMDTTINRVWRDLHTAGQHPLLVQSGW